jgi:hypothetical protein
MKLSTNFLLLKFNLNSHNKQNNVSKSRENVLCMQVCVKRFVYLRLSMKKLLLFSILSLSIPYLGYSQGGNYDMYHSLNRDEYTFGIGATQFLGDLGGSPNIGTHFLRDFNPGAIRYGGQLGYRKRINKSFAIKGVFTVAEFYGSDVLTSNQVRNNRNVSIRDIVFEPSLQAEYYFYQHDHPGHRYKIQHASGFASMAIDAYLFVGIGGVYYNPQAQFGGKWYSLRPLSTEGQGLPGGPPTYSPIAFTVPAGIGMKYLINYQWSIGMELSDRLWASSDYLDDTHGNYFSNSEILQHKGAVAAALADPAKGLNPTQDAIGQERGDPTHNDTYMLLMLTLNYRPQAHHERRHNRAKF